MSWGYNDNGGIEPSEDFDYDALDEPDEKPLPDEGKAKPQSSGLSDHERAVAALSALISWAGGADAAAARYVLKIDQRRPTVIAKELGISRQLFNHKAAEARAIKDSVQ